MISLNNFDFVYYVLSGRGRNKLIILEPLGLIFGWFFNLQGVQMALPLLITSSIKKAAVWIEGLIIQMTSEALLTTTTST